MLQKPKEDTIYILDLGKDKKADVHTFFCLEPLDIVLLDSNLNIILHKKNVKPFSIFLPREKFRYIVEGKSISQEDLEEARRFLMMKASGL